MEPIANVHDKYNATKSNHNIRVEVGWVFLAGFPYHSPSYQQECAVLGYREVGFDDAPPALGVAAMLLPA